MHRIANPCRSVRLRLAPPGFAAVAQLVERNLAKVEVESSRLFCRSKYKGKAFNAFPLFISDSSRIELHSQNAKHDVLTPVSKPSFLSFAQLLLGEGRPPVIQAQQFQIAGLFTDLAQPSHHHHRFAIWPFFSVDRSRIGWGRPGDLQHDSAMTGIKMFKVRQIGRPRVCTQNYPQNTMSAKSTGGSE